MFAMFLHEMFEDCHSAKNLSDIAVLANPVSLAGSRAAVQSADCIRAVLHTGGQHAVQTCVRNIQAAEKTAQQLKHVSQCRYVT